MRGPNSLFVLGISAGVIAGPAAARDIAPVDAALSTTAFYAQLQPACQRPAGTASAYMRFSYSGQNKTAALLGGQPSKLELIRMQQAGGSATALTSDIRPAGQLLSAMPPLLPALGQARPAKSPCFSGQGSPNIVGIPDIVRIPTPEANIAIRRNSPSEFFLASRRVPIGRTHFEYSWRRVRDQRLSATSVTRLFGTSDLSGDRLLGQVNHWVNGNIKYVEDRVLYGRSDYWADAKTTLALRKGDCEDIAIVKMQLLAAAGIASEDMFLTIVRDRIRNADHAVLIVRTSQGFVMLDNATNQILDASSDFDYQPVLSFNKTRSWLHSYTGNV